MTVGPAILATYGLLAASLMSVWCAPIPVGRRRVPPWTLLFAAACGSALLFHILAWQGAAALVLLIMLAWASMQAGAGVAKAALMVATGTMVLSLSLHKWAGFANPVLAAKLQVSMGAPPYTHHLNFDTAAAGLILLAICCQTARSRQQWRQAAAGWPIAAATAAGVVTLGVLVSFVKLDIKLSTYTPVFLFCNLMFTCITEEAFFRGFMQEQLRRAMHGWRAGPALALLVSALLFGLAHAGGGPTLVALASIAGLGYGYAYQRSGRIEAAILAHFSLNALHFLAFSYPRAL